MDVFHHPVTLDAGCLRYSRPPAFRRYSTHPWVPPCGPAIGCSNSVQPNLSGRSYKSHPVICPSGQPLAVLIRSSRISRAFKSDPIGFERRHDKFIPDSSGLEYTIVSRKQRKTRKHNQPGRNLLTNLRLLHFSRLKKSCQLISRCVFGKNLFPLFAAQLVF